MRRVQLGLALATMLQCGAWTGTAFGQGRPPGLPPDVPNIRPPQAPQVQPPPIEAPPQPPVAGDEGVRQWQDEQASRDAAAAQFTYYAPLTHDPRSDYPSRDDLTTYLEVIFGVIGIFIVAWAVLRVCAYFARPDPKKYIMSDPWVQAQLARRSVPPDQPPPASTGVTDSPGGALRSGAPPAPR